MSWHISRALMETYESLPCSLGQAGESSAATSSDGEPSAPSSTTPTPQAYCVRDKTTEAWSRFPSGMTCAPLTADRGEELLTWYRAAFRAKTSAPPEKAPASTASDQGCGQRWQGSLAKYDRDSRSWKTRQCLLAGGLEEFSETWPRWGTVRDGELYRQPTPSGLLAIRAYITSAKESGSSAPKIPTPIKDDAEHRPNPAQLRRNTIKLGVMAAPGMIPPSAVMRLPTPYGLSSNQGQGGGEFDKAVRAGQVGGQLNPTWVEWLQGFPIEWTVLDVSAMRRFQSWRRSHGRSLRVAMEKLSAPPMESLKWVELIQLREIADRVSGEAAFTGLPESLQEEIYRLQDSRCTG